ncbi:uncharacterized protein LOC135324519 isoform X1 [Dromaius novaehollandiae]|uniref:uncharacterized protein LOC135324519 isoform X1 n=1 Tax=Dromaius novaehollandiae TaxID=8790 RepID=UPI00311E857B
MQEQLRGLEQEKEELRTTLQELTTEVPRAPCQHPLGHPSGCPTTPSRLALTPGSSPQHLALAAQHAQSSQQLERTKEVLPQLQAELTEVKAEGDAARKELHQEKQSAAKLAEALREQAEIEKVLRKERECLRERREGLQGQTVGGKTEQAARLSTSLMREMVAVKLVGRTSPTGALGKKGCAGHPLALGALVSVGMRVGV